VTCLHDVGESDQVQALGRKRIVLVCDWSKQRGDRSKVALSEVNVTYPNHRLDSHVIKLIIWYHASIPNKWCASKKSQLLAARASALAAFSFFPHR
jgi:hypothetical protein